MFPSFLQLVLHSRIHSAKIYIIFHYIRKKERKLRLPKTNYYIDEWILQNSWILNKRTSSIHASTLRSISSIALPSINKCVASRSSIINFWSALFFSSNCRMNCFNGGSQVNKNPEDSIDAAAADRFEDLDYFLGAFPDDFILPENIVLYSYYIVCIIRPVLTSTYHYSLQIVSIQRSSTGYYRS